MPDVTDGGDGKSYTLTWHQDVYFAGDESPTTITSISLSIAGGTSLTYDKYGLNIDSTAVENQYHEEISVTETSYHYYFRGFGDTVIDNTIVAITVDAGLSDPYTQDDVKSDWHTLIDQFPLNDDRLYSWRTDARVTFGPLVTYDEAFGGIPTIPNCTGDDGLGSRNGDPLYTASILGKPHEFDGAAYWSDRFEIVKRKAVQECTAEGYDVTQDVYYTEGWVQSSPLGANGPHMTQWVGLYDELNTIPQYGFLKFQGDYLLGGKYAEVIVKRPSANWARPCGNDRWQINPQEAFCIKDVTSGIVTLEDYNTTPPTWNNGDTCYVCEQGIWTIQKQGDFVYRLVNQIVTQEQLANCGSSPLNSESCGNGQMTRLRWKYNQIPTLCQPVDIVDATPTNPIVITTRQSVNIVSGDLIRVRNVSGITNANGTWTVSGIDAYHFGLIGSHGSGQSGYKGGYIQNVFGVDPYWNDAQPKGDYVVKEWYTNSRDIGEATRISGDNGQLVTRPECDFLYPDNEHYCAPQTTYEIPRVNQAFQGLDQTVTSVTCKTYCLPIVPCFPSVVCISPSTGDVFPNGRRHEFPSNFDLDSSYGSEWRMEVQQDMVDPFYQGLRPAPCIYRTDYDEDGIPVTGYFRHTLAQADDGTCQQDVMDVDPETFDFYLKTKIYPFPPMVEARCSVPSGAPEPPSGIYLGCLSVSDLNTTGTVHGNLCNFIRPGVARSTPWIIYLNELGCVCGTGRFAGDYTANRVYCADNKF